MYNIYVYMDNTWCRGIDGYTSLPQFGNLAEAPIDAGKALVVFFFKSKMSPPKKIEEYVCNLH